MVKEPGSRGPFGQNQDYKRLQVPRDQVTWVEHYTPPSRPVETVLHLSCNILKTAHLACEVVDVFKHLGVDFVPVAGPQFCCGIAQHRSGQVRAASLLAGSTISKFESYSPQQVVMWCPSCQLHFEEVALKEANPSFSTIHTTAFLAERAGQFPWRQEVRARVVVHDHVGRLQSQLDAEAAVRLLSAVPGVEVVGTVHADELGYHCAGASLQRLGSEGFRKLKARLAEEARALGADTLVTLYHACQREWWDVAGDGLAVRHYISLVAEALGCGYPDLHQRFKRSGDPDFIVQDSQAIWESYGLTEGEARAMAARLYSRR